MASPLRTRLTRLITLERPVDGRFRLTCHPQDSDGLQFVLVDCGRNRIMIERNNEIRITRRMREGHFPQSIGIGRLHPRTMIAFVDGLRKRNAGLFKRSDVIAEIHKEG